MGSNSSVAEGKHHSKKPFSRCGGSSKFQIRKSKQHDLVVKKGNGRSTMPPAADSAGTRTKVAIHSRDSSKLDMVFTTYHLWANDATAVTTTQIYEATKALRVLLGQEDAKPGVTKTIINRGAVPILVKLLLPEMDPHIVAEAVLALVNVTYESGSVVYEQPNAVQHLGKLLVSLDPSVRENAAWCLGNMVCESDRYRDAIVRKQCVVDGLLRNLGQPSSDTLLTTISWVFKAIFNKKLHPIEFVRSTVPVLVSTLKSCEECNVDVATRVDLVACLAHILDGSAAIQRYCLQHGALDPIMELGKNHSKSSNRHIMLYTVRALRNVAASDDETVADELIRHGFLKHADDLLKHASPLVRQEICLALSDIASGSQDQAEALLFAGDVPHGVVRQLIQRAVCASYRERLYSLFVLCDLVTGVTTTSLSKCQALGVIATLIDALRMEGETRLLLDTMCALDRIFHVIGQQALVKFQDLGGEEALEALQQNQSEEVYLKAYELLTAHFECDDDSSSFDLDPLQEESFSFSLPAKQLFPSDAAAFDSPMTIHFSRTFGDSMLSPNSHNIMDVSITDFAQV